MHRCCSTILLSEDHLRTLLQLVEVDSADAAGMEAMLFAWLRIAFSHAPPVKYDVAGQVSYPCFEPSAKVAMLSYLEQMAARKAGGLSPQAFFLPVTAMVMHMTSYQALLAQSPFPMPSL